MSKPETLQPGNFYHIYNRGINSCNIFTDDRNYGYFLKLYEKYIFQIADTFAWVLMPNHFHFLVKTKDFVENSDRVFNPVRVKTPTPSLQFSKLFNAYAQAFNKQEERHGALFERPFKRKLVEGEDYLMELILYIHNNPVRHGFCEKPEQYQWSSYHSCISEKPTKLQRKSVLVGLMTLPILSLCIMKWQI
jgi:REP element-mobilizing transposase RayT